MVPIRFTEEYWLIRAKEALALAEIMSSAQTKAMMLGIAATYQKLAEHARQDIARGEGPGKPWRRERDRILQSPQPSQHGKPEFQSWDLNAFTEKLLDVLKALRERGS